MPSLHDLQSAFARAVLDGHQGELDHCIVADGLAPDRRLQVYRNNTRANLEQALVATYPVVRRVVGEEFFTYLVDEFARAHPSRCGDLEAYGDTLPAFIESFAPASGLPYLADVARLEWAWNEAYYAAAHRAPDPARLAAVPPGRREAVGIRLHPSVRLLESRWPVLRILEVNREGYSGDDLVDLSAGGVRVLVHRRGLQVEARGLAAAEYALLCALAAGDRLGAAAGAALAHDPGLDLAAMLARHLRDGLVADFRLD